MIWLDGWSLCLDEINYLRTGYRTGGLLDVHLVTDEDIANKTSYAVKIGAVTDAARPLALKKKAEADSDGGLRSDSRAAPPRDPRGRSAPGPAPARRARRRAPASGRCAPPGPGQARRFVDVPVQGEQGLALLDEAPDGDAADVNVERHVVDDPAVERRAIQAGAGRAGAWKSTTAPARSSSPVSALRSAGDGPVSHLAACRPAPSARPPRARPIPGPRSAPTS